MGIQEGFGDWSRSEGIGLDEDGALGLIQFPEYCISRSAVGGEINFPGPVGGFFLRDGDDRREKYIKDSD